jgi:hypothetical protein
LTVTFTLDQYTVHLEVRHGPSPALPEAVSLPQRVLHLLRQQVPGTLRRYELREALGVNNTRLGEALSELERLGFASRTSAGWHAADGKSTI